MTADSVDGWYLMTPDEVVRAVAEWKRDPTTGFRGLTKLTIPEALAFRDAGNIPTPEGRSLRLVITVNPDAGVDSVSARRIEFEPDFHDAPTWRKGGSKPVNVVPLRMRDHYEDKGSDAWWDDAKVAPLEAEWTEHGTVAGLPVPGELRSFVYKTVIALKASGQEITADSVADSVARWLGPLDAERLRSALKEERRRG